MEAVAVLALACNVSQLVEQSLQIGTIVKEIYQDGSLKSHDELRLESESLQKFATDVKTPQHSTSEQELKSIADDCIEIAKSLQQDFKQLTSTGRWVADIKTGWRAYRKRESIEKLVQRLERHQQRLNTGLLVSIRNQVNELIVDRKVDIHTLDDKSRNFLNQLNANLSNKIDSSATDTQTAVISDLGARIDESTKQTHLLFTKNLDERYDAHQNQKALTELTDRMGGSFWYPDIDARDASIETNGTQHYSWLYDAAEYRSRMQHVGKSWSSISEWLASDDRLYWIQGKAGSGKSTVMKMLWQNFNTQWLLSEATGVPGDDDADREKYRTKTLSRGTCILEHSFWLAGLHEMQRNFTGLLCHLLFQLMTVKPDSVMTSAAVHPTMRQKRSFREWQREELTSLLLKALAEVSQHCVVCLFLDGLDEIQMPEDRSDMVDFIDSCSVLPKVKICVSSRFDYPWIDAFDKLSQLCLEDLTRADIDKFIKKALRKAWDINKILGEEEEKERDRFAREISFKADGVFLWVRLALRALLVSSKHATWSERKQRLATLPPGIIDLYDDMLSRRGHDPATVKSEAAAYFRLCLDESMSMPTAFLHHCVVLRMRHFSDKKSLDCSSDYRAFYTQYIRLRERIQDICAGMISLENGCSLSESDLKSDLEESFWEETDEGYRYEASGGKTEFTPERFPLQATQLDLHHRTVRDFLIDTRSGQDTLRNCTLTPFQFLSAYVEAELLRPTLGIAKCDSILVGNLLSTISRFEKASGEWSNPEVVELVLRIRETLLKLVQNPATEAIGHEIALESKTQAFYRSHIPRDDEMNPEPGFQFLSYQDNKFLFAVDVQGLSLLHGISSCFMLQMLPILRSADGKVQAMSQHYKDYLLLCAVHGNLPDIALMLVDHGGDLYAPFFPPQELSWKTCAAAEILIQLSAYSRPEEIEYDVEKDRAARKESLALWAPIILRSRQRTCCVLVSSGTRLHEDKGGLFTAMMELNQTTCFLQMDQDLLYDAFFLVDVKAHLRHLVLRFQQHLIAPEDTNYSTLSTQQAFIGAALLPETYLSEQQIIPYQAESLLGLNSIESQATEDPFFNYASYQSCPFCLLRKGDELWTCLTQRRRYLIEPIQKGLTHWKVRDTLNSTDYELQSRCFERPHRMGGRYGSTSWIAGISLGENRRIMEGTYLLVQPKVSSRLDDSDAPVSTDACDDNTVTASHEAATNTIADQVQNVSFSTQGTLIALVEEIRQKTMHLPDGKRRPQYMEKDGRRGVATIWSVEGANDWIKEVGWAVGLLKDPSDPEVLRAPIPRFVPLGEIQTSGQDPAVDSSMDETAAEPPPVSRANTIFFDAEEHMDPAAPEQSP